MAVGSFSLLPLSPYPFCTISSLFFVVISLVSRRFVCVRIWIWYAKKLYNRIVPSERCVCEWVSHCIYYLIPIKLLFSTDTKCQLEFTVSFFVKRVTFNEKERNFHCDGKMMRLMVSVLLYSCDILCCVRYAACIIASQNNRFPQHNVDPMSGSNRCCWLSFYAKWYWILFFESVEWHATQMSHCNWLKFCNRTPDRNENAIPFYVHVKRNKVIEIDKNTFLVRSATLTMHAACWTSRTSNKTIIASILNYSKSIQMKTEKEKVKLSNSMNKSTIDACRFRFSFARHFAPYGFLPTSLLSFELFCDLILIFSLHIQVTATCMPI